MFHASSAPLKEFYTPGQTKEPGRKVADVALVQPEARIMQAFKQMCFAQCFSQKSPLLIACRSVRIGKPPNNGLNVAG